MPTSVLSVSLEYLTDNKFLYTVLKIILGTHLCEQGGFPLTCVNTPGGYECEVDPTTFQDGDIKEFGHLLSQARQFIRLRMKTQN